MSPSSGMSRSARRGLRAGRRDVRRTRPEPAAPGLRCISPKRATGAVARASEGRIRTLARRSRAEECRFYPIREGQCEYGGLFEDGSDAAVDGLDNLLGA